MKELLKTVTELLISINHILSTNCLPPPKPVEEEVWLDSCDVRIHLQIGYMTLYRRRCAGEFVAKKIGKRWYYLKSSLN